MSIPDWIESYPGAVTVTDTEHQIIYMNQAAAVAFADDGGKALVGTNLLTCHNPESRGIIERLLRDGAENLYTVEKQGKKRLVHQVAWRDQRGEIGGLIEITLSLPKGLPNKVR